VGLVEGDCKAILVQVNLKGEQCFANKKFKNPKP
jgi:hypothetical protein